MKMPAFLTARFDGRSAVPSSPSRTAGRSADRGGRATAAFALIVPIALAGLILPAQAQDIAAGKQKADEVCFACHGQDGNTPLDPSYPKLAGQYQDYLEHALLDYKNDRRQNPLMGPQAKLLSREDIRNVAAYYASLPGTITNRR